MVKRVFNFIGKEIGGLHEAAYLLGIFALLSQILALVRDRLLAASFGADQSLDLYYAAFRIPDFIFVSIASIVSLSVLIPFLMERLDQGQAEAKKFIDAIFSIFFFFIGAVAIIAWILTPYLLKLFFPALTQNFDTLVSMTRIMLFSPIFLGFSNFLASITQIYRRFFIYALSPVMYNLGIIIGILVFLPLWGIQGLAWGVALGAFLHCFIQIPFVWKKELFPQLQLRPHVRAVRQVLLISLPRTLAVSSNEISEFFLVALASGLAGGAISIFNFAWNLQSVPLSIIGVSYSLAAFPLLTKLFTTGDNKKFVDQMISSTRHIIFWSIPIMTLFIVLRAQIVRVILGSGRFDWSDTRLTAAALALFTISLVPQSLVLLFVRSYYARGKTRRPLFTNVASAGLIILFSYLLVQLFHQSQFFKYFIESLLRVEDLPGAVVLMLPLGFSLGVGINLVVHWIAFEKDFKGYSAPVLRALFQILSASIIMGYVTHILLEVLDNYFNINTFVGIFLQGFLAGIGGIIVGLVLLVVLKNRELRDISATFHKKIWKAKVVPPDTSI
jgi:putative peptidoglycan lipid II flippase